MLTSIASITLIAGLALVLVGLLGGGIEVKEIKIPTIPVVPRMACILIGCALTALMIFDRKVFDDKSNDPSPGSSATTSGAPAAIPAPGQLGSAIPRLIQVRDVKRILQHLGFYNGQLGDDTDEAYFRGVSDFQRAKNITQDGLVGGETYGKLRDSWPEFFGDKGLSTSSK